MADRTYAEPRRARLVNLLERTGNGLVRWLTKNHEFNPSPYLDPPAPGLLGTIRYAIKYFLLSVGIPITYYQMLLQGRQIYSRGAGTIDPVPQDSDCQLFLTQSVDLTIGHRRKNRTAGAARKNVVFSQVALDRIPEPHVGYAH